MVADEQDDEDRRVGAHASRGRRGDPLARQRAADGEHDERSAGSAPNEHRDAAEQVGEGDAVGADVAGVRLE